MHQQTPHGENSHYIASLEIKNSSTQQECQTKKYHWIATAVLIKEAIIEYMTSIAIIDNSEWKKEKEKAIISLAPTLCPNMMVLDVSPRWRGDGPIVTTSEVLAVPGRM